jgi:hypothetical protein
MTAVGVQAGDGVHDCLVWTLPVRSKVSRRIRRIWAACARVSISMPSNRMDGPGSGPAGRASTRIDARSWLRGKCHDDAAIAYCRFTRTQVG